MRTGITTPRPSSHSRDLVVKELKPHAVVLFGSFAKGEINEGSDVDIMVIADFKESFLDRIKVLLDLNEAVKLPLEPVGYSPEEFQGMNETGNRFIQEVLTTGKVLYGKVPGDAGQGGRIKCH